MEGTAGALMLVQGRRDRALEAMEGGNRHSSSSSSSSSNNNTTTLIMMATVTTTIMIMVGTNRITEASIMTQAMHRAGNRNNSRTITITRKEEVSPGVAVAVEARLCLVDHLPTTTVESLRLGVA
jgi:hypothetical protein